MKDITLKKLTAAYGKGEERQVVIKDLDVTFRAGEISVVMGASGSGKTTLIKSIGGLLNYEGDVLFGQDDAFYLSYGKKNISYVTENSTLYPSMSIFDNAALALKKQKLSRDEITRRIKSFAEILDIVGCLNALPRHLSLGQQQRAAVLKALVKEPSVCLMDEPMGSLDPESKTACRRLIRSALKKCGATTVYVTHDLAEALSVADRIFILRDGSISTSFLPQNIGSVDDDLVRSMLNSLKYGWE